MKQQTASLRHNDLPCSLLNEFLDLSQVKYSIAIESDCWLYLNDANPTSYIDTTNHESFAVWSPFKTLTPGLHYRSNNLVVVIRDRSDINYFSMAVTTNTCGQ